MAFITITPQHIKDFLGGKSFEDPFVKELTAELVDALRQENKTLDEPAYYCNRVDDPEIEAARKANGQIRPLRRNEALPSMSPDERHKLRKEVSKNKLGKILLESTHGQGPKTKIEGKLWRDLIACYNIYIDPTRPLEQCETTLAIDAMEVVWNGKPTWVKEGLDAPWVPHSNGFLWKAESYDKYFTAALDPNREKWKDVLKTHRKVQKRLAKEGIELDP